MRREARTGTRVATRIASRPGITGPTRRHGWQSVTSTVLHGGDDDKCGRRRDPISHAQPRRRARHAHFLLRHATAGCHRPRTAGRKSDGRDGNRTGNTGHQRSLTVNNGQSKTGPDQGHNALTRVGNTRTRWFDSPQLHPQLHEKCHLPGETQGVGGVIVPPSTTLVDQGDDRHRASAQPSRTTSMETTTA